MILKLIIKDLQERESMIFIDMVQISNCQITENKLSFDGACYHKHEVLNFDFVMSKVIGFYQDKAIEPPKELPPIPERAKVEMPERFKEEKPNESKGKKLPKSK